MEAEGKLGGQRWQHCDGTRHVTRAQMENVASWYDPLSCVNEGVNKGVHEKHTCATKASWEHGMSGACPWFILRHHRSHCSD